MDRMIERVEDGNKKQKTDRNVRKQPEMEKKVKMGRNQRVTETER